MNNELNPTFGHHGAGLLNLDDFYVRRINWLVTMGRSDLIDEIADDHERRRPENQLSTAQSGQLLSEP
jgi:hypothetical protein